MKKSIFNVLIFTLTYVGMNISFLPPVLAAEPTIQTSVANSVNLVMRSGNDEKSISYALDWLSPYPKADVLAQMLSDVSQVTQPPSRRRQEAAVRLIVLASGADYVAPVIAELGQQPNPVRLSLLMRMLSDLKYEGIKQTLRPFLDDKRISGELIGEERASGAAMRVCDEAFNAIQKCEPNESKRSLLRPDTLTEKRDVEIQFLKANLPQ